MTRGKLSAACAIGVSVLCSSFFCLPVFQNIYCYSKFAVVFSVLYVCIQLHFYILQLKNFNCNDCSHPVPIRKEKEGAEGGGGITHLVSSLQV